MKHTRVKKHYVSSILITLSTIITWSSVYYFIGTTENTAFGDAWLFPLLWSSCIIYLHHYQYTYVALNSYLLFLLMIIADKINFHTISIHTQLTYLLLAFATAFLFIGIIQLSHSIKWPKIKIINVIFSCLLLVLPTFYLVYVLNFASSVSKETIYAIMQTNLKEAVEFFTAFVSPMGVVFFALLILATTTLLIKQKHNDSQGIEIKSFLFILIVFLTLSYLDRKNNQLYDFTLNAMKTYWQEIALFKQTQAQLKNHDIAFTASKHNTGETYIVIIGESLNKRHMSLYGYMRETTPILDKMAFEHQLIIYENAFSAHTHTMPVLSKALTEATQQNQKAYFHSLSIINILNKANIDTYWLTNQLLYGAWDNLVSIIAHQASHLFPFNRSMGKSVNTQSYDGAMLTKLSQILAKATTRNRVLFVHLMGNHSNYCTRYPAAYQFYHTELPVTQFGQLANKSPSLTASINCYDNSVRYNDFIVSSIINQLKQSNGVRGLLYFADHSEDIIKQLGHNHGNFTYEMTQIPLIFWLSPEYKARYPKKYRLLKQHDQQLFSNDDIYDTLIGFMDINTHRYEASNDLTSPDYQLQPENAVTLNSKKWYAGPDNHLYQQAQNGLLINQSQLGSRILAHRVNTIGKLSNIWTDHFRSFEVDVLFDENSNQFLVGHDRHTLSGITLTQLISAIPAAEIKTIWLDFKNLNEKNSKKALSRLNTLATQIPLKNKLIIESDTTDPTFAMFNNAGWYTSYYLPTTAILPALESNKVDELTKLAQKITLQSKAQRLSAVSFDHRVYPFVKQYLEPLLDKQVDYLTWDLSISLFDAELESKLNKKSYYHDRRVKTILLYYQSPFNL
ncbi:phosphoethanolamine transferase [uncultured Shewanella sp.]|uniref:phosphoethanolamine transferase n=1 Tax=uncultured Shewanella sp. TaxID=173975 RepID=UPI002610E61C|nr:phosphoethanolamine transferase [uncultured Shewanella sp.]